MARKQTLKATVTDVPFTEAPQSAAPDTEDTLRARMHAAVEDFLNQPVVSWKRVMCAWIAGLTVAVGVGYLGGIFAAYLTVGAVLVSGSAFIGMLMYCLSLVFAAYLGFKLSVFTHMKIIDGSVDEMFVSVRNSVRGWFGSSAIESVAS